MAKQKRKNNEVGYIAFLLGLLWVFLAAAMDTGLIASFVPVNVTTVGLVLISLLVAYSNITDEEIDRFLLVSLSLAVVSTATFQNLPYIGAYVNSVMNYLKLLVLPGTLLVALRVGYELLKD